MNDTDIEDSLYLPLQDMYISCSDNITNFQCLLEVIVNFQYLLGNFLKHLNMIYKCFMNNERERKQRTVDRFNNLINLCNSCLLLIEKTYHTFILASDEVRIFDTMTEEITVSSTRLKVFLEDVFFEESGEESDIKKFLGACMKLIPCKTCFPRVSILSRAWKNKESHRVHPQRVVLVCSPSISICEYIGYGYVLDKKEFVRQLIEKDASLIDLRSNLNISDVNAFVEDNVVCNTQTKEIDYPITVTKWVNTKKDQEPMTSCYSVKMRVLIERQQWKNIKIVTYEVKSEELDSTKIMSHQKLWNNECLKLIHTLSTDPLYTQEDQITPELQSLNLGASNNQTYGSNNQLLKKHKKRQNNHPTSYVSEVRVINAIQKVLNNSLKSILSSQITQGIEEYNSKRLLEMEDIIYVTNYARKLESQDDTPPVIDYNGTIMYHRSTIDTIWEPLVYVFKFIMYSKKVNNMWINGLFYGFMEYERASSIVSNFPAGNVLIYFTMSSVIKEKKALKDKPVLRHAIFCWKDPESGRILHAIAKDMVTTDGSTNIASVVYHYITKDIGANGIIRFNRISKCQEVVNVEALKTIYATKGGDEYEVINPERYLLLPRER